MAVTGITYETSPFDGGRSFGPAGAYEYLQGTVEIALDPRHPRNSVITDLDKIPTNEDGRVRAVADFALLRPVDPARGNRRLLIDVPNRGNKLALRMFDRTPAATMPTVPSDGEPVPGDGWLLEAGWIVGWCGWQHDVPASTALMGIELPEVPGVTGVVGCRFQIDAATTTLEVSDRGHQPYPATDLEQADAVLVVRETPDGEPTEIDRADWRFSDATHIEYPAGFRLGAFYELTYRAQGARPTGVGLAALSDLASFLRHDSTPNNPGAGRIDHVYGYGASQSGGVLRTMLYHGLDVDEAGHLAFDGIFADIAGSFRSEVNWRFGQPSYFGPRSASYVFPFADVVIDDPLGGPSDGLLRRVLERGQAPKVFYTYTSSEYWALHASLTHTTTDGASDLDAPANVRIYHVAGTQHGGGRFPPVTEVPELGLFTELPINIIDTHPFLRAALTNLDDWVTGRVDPPPSAHPTIADGTLVPASALAATFDQIPGLSLPIELPALTTLDYGAPAGAMSTVPPVTGHPLGVRVSAVNRDGNETGGIRLPEVEVALATHTAWNRRPAQLGGAGQRSGLTGASVAFPRTENDRVASGDSRLSNAERYTSEAAYLELIEAAATELVVRRHLLADDVPLVVESARRSYRWFTAG